MWHLDHYFMHSKFKFLLFPFYQTRVKFLFFSAQFVRWHSVWSLRRFDRWPRFDSQWQHRRGRSHLRGRARNRTRHRRTGEQQVLIQPKLWLIGTRQLVFHNILSSSIDINVTLSSLLCFHVLVVLQVRSGMWDLKTIFVFWKPSTKESPPYLSPRLGKVRSDTYACFSNQFFIWFSGQGEPNCSDLELCDDAPLHGPVQPRQEDRGRHLRRHQGGNHSDGRSRR